MWFSIAIVFGVSLNLLVSRINNSSSSRTDIRDYVSASYDDLVIESAPRAKGVVGARVPYFSEVQDGEYSAVAKIITNEDELVEVMIPESEEVNEIIANRKEHSDNISWPLFLSVFSFLLFLMGLVSQASRHHKLKELRADKKKSTD